MLFFLILGTMLLMAMIVTTAPVAVPAVTNPDGTTAFLADQLDSELTFQPLPAVIVASIPNTTPEPVVSLASSESSPHRGKNATSHEPIQIVKRGDRAEVSLLLVFFFPFGARVLVEFLLFMVEVIRGDTILIKLYSSVGRCCAEKVMGTTL